jgi:2,3-bisphosphoglycerate-dependent phosphoglycerate mutase
MKTIIYYVRHAKPINNWDWQYDNLRPLTIEGEMVSQKLGEKDIFKNVDAIYSSPYSRAINTAKYIAEVNSLNINIIDDLSERKYGDVIEDRALFRKKQWLDHNYKAINGESFIEVEDRNIEALKSILNDNLGKTVLIFGHAMSGASIIYHYNSLFNYDDFVNIPYTAIFRLEFDDDNFKKIELLY